MPRMIAVASKELREIFRDPLFLALVFLVPSMLMLLFGYGLSLEVDDIPFAVVDYDQTAASREYAYRFIDSHYFAFRGYLQKERDLAPRLMDGDLRAAIIIPEHFQQGLLESRAVEVQTLVDGTFRIVPRRSRATCPRSRQRRVLNSRQTTWRTRPF